MIKAFIEKFYTNKTYFTYDELKCPCCGECKTTGEAFRMIYVARVIANTRFKITSGYRCPKHNAEEGSTSENHIRGEAFDIYCTESWLRIKIIAGLILVGFRRIGIHKTFIHVDRMDQHQGDIQPALWIGKNPGQ